MSKIIVKINGTSGAGKSYVAHELLRIYPHEAIYEDIEILGYRVVPPNFKVPIYVIGRYASNCGGCDTINSEEQIRRLHHFAELGHVLYEGLLSSEYYGKLGEASERYGPTHVFAFIDTPIETCIERIKARRLAKGNTKPLNEENTRGRVKKIEALKVKLQRMGRKVVTIEHRNSFNQVYGLFEEADRG